MVIKVASITDTFGKDVFTNKGSYCGKVEDLECDLKRFKIRALQIKAVKGSYVSKLLGGKKGLIVPFPMVESIGDIVIIKHIPSPEIEETKEEEE